LAISALGGLPPPSWGRSRWVPGAAAGVAGAGRGMPVSLNLTRAELLQKCVQVIDSFDPKRTTVDAYMEDCEALKDKRIGEVEHKFIHQVFYGCSRYQKFLRLFVTSFLYKSPGITNRSEQSLYTIYAYLIFFRLEELGVEELRLFMNCGVGTVTAVFALFQYALDKEELEKWVKMEWCKVYDVKYIEDEVIEKLQSFAEELQPALSDLEFKATGTVTGGGADATCLPEKRRGTSPKPFNLTRPKPRLVPEPEVISRDVKAMPVPAGLHKTSLVEVEAEKKRRREEEKGRLAAKYASSKYADLEVAKPKDTTEVEELTRKVEAERMAECTFKPKPAKKYIPPAEEAVVRQNAAAVLREDALLKQKQAKEYQVLKRYEEDLHDASEFSRWQQEMRQKDQLEEDQRVHQRIVEMQLAREGAVEAYESEVRKRHIMAQVQKEELQLQFEVREQESKVELMSKQGLVKQTQEERENARAAEEQVLKARADVADQVRKEKEAEFERKRREDEQEMEKRKDIIRQIRALEKVPVERFKTFDPAEQPCQGLLEEMSLAELRERLQITQARQAKELEEKRERQLEKKLEKQQELAEKAETLAKIRERAKEEHQVRSASVRRQKEESEMAQKAYREKCILEVADRIQQKKQQKHQEELRLKKELKELSAKRQFLQANADHVEAKAHAEQHHGLEREARDRQRNLLLDQARQNIVKNRDAAVARTNRQNDQNEYKAMQEAVNERLRRAKASSTQLKDDILRANTSARNSQKTIERRLKEEIGHSSNKYLQRVAQRMAVSA